MAASKKDSPIATLAAKPLKFQVGVLVGVLVVVFFVYYQAFFSPLDEELAGANGEYSRLSKTNRDLKEKKEERARLLRRKEALDLKLRTNEVSLPLTAALPSFIGKLQREAAVAGVSFKSTNLQKEVPGPNFVKVPVSVEVQGTFHQIMKYFHLLSNTDRIITIENFSLKPEKADSDLVLLRAAFRASTFRQPNSAREEAQEAAKAKQAPTPGAAPATNEGGTSPADKIKAAQEARPGQVDEKLEREGAGGTPAEPAASGLDRLKSPGNP